MTCAIEVMNSLFFLHALQRLFIWLVSCCCCCCSQKRVIEKTWQRWCEEKQALVSSFPKQWKKQNLWKNLVTKVRTEEEQKLNEAWTDPPHENNPNGDHIFSVFSDGAWKQSKNCSGASRYWQNKCFILLYFIAL